MEAYTGLEILEAFENLISLQPLPTKLRPFVDGLEEYRGDPADIVEALKSLLTSSAVNISI